MLSVPWWLPKAHYHPRIFYVPDTHLISTCFSKQVSQSCHIQNQTPKVSTSSLLSLPAVVNCPSHLLLCKSSASAKSLGVNTDTFSCIPKAHYGQVLLKHVSRPWSYLTAAIITPWTHTTIPTRWLQRLLHWLSASMPAWQSKSRQG